MDTDWVESLSFILGEGLLESGDVRNTWFRTFNGNELAVGWDRWHKGHTVSVNCRTLLSSSGLGESKIFASAEEAKLAAEEAAR